MLRQLSSQWGFYSSVLQQRIRNHSACRRTCHPVILSHGVYDTAYQGAVIYLWFVVTLLNLIDSEESGTLRYNFQCPPSQFNIGKMLSLRQHFTFHGNSAVAELVRSIYGKRPPYNLILLVTPVNQVRPIFCQKKKLTYFSNRNKSVSKLFQGDWKRKPWEMSYGRQPRREISGDNEVGILGTWL